MKNVLIIGFGSIGKKHASAFKKNGANIGFVSSQIVENETIYKSMSEGVKYFNPDIIVIANITDQHENSLKELIFLGFKGNVLIEKPVGKNVFSLPLHNFASIQVAYNLRTNPLLTTLKNELTGKKLISSFAYCGQYLPEWRPSRDYRETYSAKKDEGGGVLRDLSHELDYMQWLCGNLKTVYAIGGHFSHLEIDSDDSYTLLGHSEICPVINISVSYLDRVVKRQILIQTDQDTYFADFIEGKLLRNSEIILSDIKVNTYEEQAQKILNNKAEIFCTFEQGMQTLRLVEACEVSSKEKRVVFL